MKATSVAPANIAFIKYWGKDNDALRLPLNDSISMNLSGAYTTTTVEFLPSLKRDEVTLVDGRFSDKEIDRVISALALIRQKAGIPDHARVMTQNTFPKGAGAAASASGFAALTVAAFAAAGVTLSEKELTIFARQGSGSACRSIPDGFVVWEKGNSSETSYAYSLYPHEYWDLRDVLAIVHSGMKKVSTTEGHTGVTTSPFWTERMNTLPKRMVRIQNAMKAKNFQAFGEIIEEDTLDMHRVMQTQVPPLMYWNDTTSILMEAVKRWRSEGVAAYFTIDAGPNVHILCEGKDEEKVLEKLNTVTGIESVIINKPSEGAKIITEHLF